MSEFIPASRIQEISHNAMEQFGHLLIDEEGAKKALLTGMLMGANVTLAGEPGGSKSTLARDSYRIIEGISSDNIATIPPQADLTATQLVGGRVASEQEVDGKITRMATVVKSLITPETQVIFGDEVSRVAPLALNAMLPALEERIISSTAGEKKLDKLQYAVMTMNPSEERQGTFPITHANASRATIGAILGADEGSEETVWGGIYDRFKPSPGKMQAVMELDDLAEVRNYANHQVALPESLRKEFYGHLHAMRNVLKDQGIKEAPGRMGVQVRDVALMLAALDGQQEITRTNVQQATAMVAMGRLSMLGARTGEPAGVIEDIKDRADSRTE